MTFKKILIGSLITVLFFGILGSVLPPVTFYVTCFGLLFIGGVYAIYKDNCPKILEDGNTYCSPSFNHRLPRPKEVILYIVEYCRLFCYDHWMKYDSKSNSKWSKFWVKMHGFFWSIMYGRISIEDWHILCDKISKNKNKNQKKKSK